MNSFSIRYVKIDCLKEFYDIDILFLIRIPSWNQQA